MMSALPIRRDINFKKMEVFPEAIITTAEGFVTPKWGIPHRLPTPGLEPIGPDKVFLSQALLCLAFFLA